MTTHAPEIEIRPYEPRDHDAVAALVLGIQNGEFGATITYEQQPDLVDPGRFFGDLGGAFWVALADGEVAGTIGLIDVGGGNAGLRKMFVRADLRGGPHNIAGRLLEVLLERARARGFGAIYLDTIDAFRAAHRFYARSGFDEIPREALPDDFPVMPGGSKFFRMTL